MSLCFGFMVCRLYHDKRTRSLWEVVCKRLVKKGWDCLLFGGFEQMDEIPIIKICERDDYLSNKDKTFGILRYYGNLDYDWYFIGDDDTFINVDNMERLVASLGGGELGLYGCVDWTSDEPKILHAHGGAGYLMNRETLLELMGYVGRVGFVEHELYGDVSLARTIYCYNREKEREGKDCMKFSRVGDMFNPWVDLKYIDISKCITIHVKDRVSFLELEKRAYGV